LKTHYALESSSFSSLPSRPRICGENAWGARPAADKPKGDLCKTGVAASRQRAALFNLLEKCGGLPTAATMKGIFLEVSKGVDWSWPGRIMSAKSGGREGTRPSDFGFFRLKTSNDKVNLSE